jgi:hypothetical protein
LYSFSYVLLLSNWQERPETMVQSPGRKYLAQAIEHHTTNDELAAKLDRVTALLESLLTLQGRGPTPAGREGEAQARGRRRGIGACSARCADSGAHSGTSRDSLRPLCGA